MIRKIPNKSIHVNDVVTNWSHAFRRINFLVSTPFGVSSHGQFYKLFTLHAMIFGPCMWPDFPRFNLGLERMRMTFRQKLTSSHA